VVAPQTPTGPFSLGRSFSSCATAASFCSTETKMGTARNHSLEIPHAAGGLSNDCASFQSAVEIQKADDGE